MASRDASIRILGPRAQIYTVCQFAPLNLLLNPTRATLEKYAHKEEDIHLILFTDAQSLQSLTWTALHGRRVFLPDFFLALPESLNVRDDVPNRDLIPYGSCVTLPHPSESSAVVTLEALPTDASQTRCVWRLTVAIQETWTCVPIAGAGSLNSLGPPFKAAYILGEAGAAEPVFLGHWLRTTDCPTQVLLPALSVSELTPPLKASNLIRHAIEVMQDAIKTALFRQSSILIVADDPVSTFLLIGELLLRQTAAIPQHFQSPVTIFGENLRLALAALDSSLLQATATKNDAFWRSDNVMGAHRFVDALNCGRLQIASSVQECAHLARDVTSVIFLMAGGRVARKALEACCELVEQADDEVTEAVMQAGSEGEAKVEVETASASSDDYRRVIEAFLEKPNRLVIDLHNNASILSMSNDLTSALSTKRAEYIPLELPLRSAWQPESLSGWRLRVLNGNEPCVEKQAVCLSSAENRRLLHLTNDLAALIPCTRSTHPYSSLVPYQGESDDDEGDLSEEDEGPNEDCRMFVDVHTISDIFLKADKDN